MNVVSEIDKETDVALHDEELETLVNMLQSEEKIKSSNDSEGSPQLETEDFYSLSLRVEDIEDEKKYSKFVRSVERLVRSSPEYRLWTNYIKEILGVDVCEVTKESGSQVTIEIHHHPFGLYSIISSEIRKMITASKKFCSLDIALLTLDLHFSNNIGYIPLVKTIHEKFHNGFINIPMEFVRGNYTHLLENNFGFLDEVEQKVVNSRLMVNVKNCGWKSGYKWIEESNEH